MPNAAAVRAVAAALALACGFSGRADATDVAVCTDHGRFVIALADVQAPRQVANFLEYVDTGFYAGTVLHRVVPGFVVQGGGVDRELRPREPRPPVENESRNALSNVRGSVAAARGADPNSADAQFFVNLDDNRALDAGEELGYTVFGRVTEGLSVLDRVSQLPTAAAGPFTGDVPQPLVAIRSITRLDSAALAELPPENLAAAVKERALTAAESGDHAAALKWAEQHHALCGALDAEVLVTEAAAAAALGRPERARHVLEEYLRLVAEDDPTFAAALELYRGLALDGTFVAAGGTRCEKPQAPSVPDGAVATIDEMVAAQEAVRGFVSGSETYLECLSGIIDDQQQNAASRNAAIGEHNQTVAAMETLAEDFNAEVREFRARE